MEDKNLNQQFQAEGTHSNIIFGTSSDDLQRGLDNHQFVEPGDEEQVVNEQEQNAIVNPSEETFNEEPAPPVTQTDKTINETKPAPTELKENVIDLDVDENDIDKSGKVSKPQD